MSLGCGYHRGVSKCVVQENIHAHPNERLTEIPRGRGVSKAQFFERKYDTKMEVLEGWGFQTKRPFVGGVWIFSGTTQYLNAVTQILLTWVAYN